MPFKINYTFQYNEEGQPATTLQGLIETEVVTELRKTVDANSDEEVDISPDAVGKLLIISASSYKDTTYSVTGGVQNVTLDGPHILIGSGAVGLLKNGQAVMKMTFKNAGAENVDISVMLAREAA